MIPDHGQPGENRAMQKITVILADDHTVVCQGLCALLRNEDDISKGMIENPKVAETGGLT